MAEIRPFRGVHYNPTLLKDLSKVICPVYDIISPEQQKELYRKSEYNFIRLEFGRELPKDSASDNKYTRSADALEQWLHDGILVTDEKPAIYLYDQYFNYHGKEIKRRSITVRVRLEEWDKKIIRPHETTGAAPKADRISLLWAIQSNISAVLALFEDKKKQIAAVLTKQEKNRPFIDGKFEGERHVVRAITELETVKQITGLFADKFLYVADGHHRYESALTFRREKTAAMKSVTGEEPFNFVMMTLIDFTDPGLLILPTHRLVRGIPRQAVDGLKNKLQIFFDIEELPANEPGVWKQVDELAKTDKPQLVVLGLAKDSLQILSLRDQTAASKLMPYFHSDIYKSLEVSIIDYVILENLLALSNEEQKSSIAYTYDRLEAMNKVSTGEYQLAFLTKSIRSELIKEIADAGDIMPRKSTYFYPKVPAGLIFNRLV